jgi:hypothetical protein
MCPRKSLAALTALAAAATMALPVAGANAAPTSPYGLGSQLISNPVAANATGTLCLMLSGETQGAQLFGNAILTSRLQQTSGYMSCASSPATPAFPGWPAVG